MTTKSLKQARGKGYHSFPQQEKLRQVIKAHDYTLAVGGGRSGKTIEIISFLVFRALLYPGIRQLVLRSTLKDARRAIWRETLPEVLKLIDGSLYSAFKTEGDKRLRVNSTDMTLEFENGSIITVSALDDNGRLESILGTGYCSIFCNEVSQMPSYEMIGLLMTRLSQVVDDGIGGTLPPKFIADCNPPTKSHWCYKAFIALENPTDRNPWPKPKQWGHLFLNPIDNPHLPPGYVDKLRDTLSKRVIARMVDGLFSVEVEGALFHLDDVNANRVHKDEDFDMEDFLAKMVRIVVAVDPASTSNAKSDETGIIVAGRDGEGQVYILADKSLKGSPQAVSTSIYAAYDEFQADEVVVESNGGQDWIRDMIRISANGAMKVTKVNAWRNKVLRADGPSELYELGKVSHVGEFEKLEEQMETFTYEYDRSKHGSPDRLDAMIYAVMALAVKNRRPPVMHTGAFVGF